MPNNVTADMPQMAKATRLSDEAYRDVVDLYFEAVLEYSAEAQEQEINVEVEHYETPVSRSTCESEVSYDFIRL